MSTLKYLEVKWHYTWNLFQNTISFLKKIGEVNLAKMLVKAIKSRQWVYRTSVFCIPILYTSLKPTSLWFYITLKLFKIRNYEKTAITLYCQNHEPPSQMLHPEQDKIHHHATKEQRKDNADIRSAFMGKTQHLWQQVHSEKVPEQGEEAHSHWWPPAESAAHTRQQGAPRMKTTQNPNVCAKVTHRPVSRPPKSVHIT